MLLPAAAVSHVATCRRRRLRRLLAVLAVLVVITFAVVVVIAVLPVPVHVEDSGLWQASTKRVGKIRSKFRNLVQELSS